MNKQNKHNQDHFTVLRKIGNKPNSSQRKFANELRFSLGKLNYCLKGLAQVTEKVEISLITNPKKYINKINL